MRMSKALFAGDALFTEPIKRRKCLKWMNSNVTKYRVLISLADQSFVDDNNRVLTIKVYISLVVFFSHLEST